MAAPAKALGRRKSHRRRKEDDDMYRVAPVQKPPNQEKLSAEELQQEVVRTLTTFDVLKPKNNIVWDFKENAFVLAVDDESSYSTLFSMASELVDPGDVGDADTDELGDLIDDISEKEEDENAPKVEVVEEAPKPVIAAKLAPNVSGKTDAKEEDIEEPEEEKEEAPAAAGSEGSQKKLLNLFNFCERAAQTETFKHREHSVQTENPVKAHYRDMCNQWIIYDAYKADAVNRPVEKEAGKDDFVLEGDENNPGAEHAQTHEEHSKDTIKKDDLKLAEKPKVKMRKASYLSEGYQTGGGDQAIMLKAVDGLRFMERLVGCNVFEDVIEDFKYYEDGADEYRDPSEPIYGTLLPLWKFHYDKAKKMHVTSISWSISEPDMFAVTFGSFNFMHPVRHGLVLVYTLRNTTYPEFAWTAPRGAMSCQVHPQRNCLVAVGLYDGNVGVLNLEKNEDNQNRTEILRNVATVLKHRGAIWSVKWGPDDIDGNPVFYSSGLDGKLMQWTIGTPDTQQSGGLQGTELATFHLPNNPVPGPDGTRYKLFGCGRVLAFHPKEKTIFLVGTAEGKVLKCCVNYASKFQMVFDAHYLPVAALEWNHYHTDIFLSASEDWTIKIWDQDTQAPMYMFEVGVPILDACWAPYSSTVFAGSTDEGKVLVYDLVINKERPICNQQVVTKKKVRPHRLQFNPLHPILILGDDKSGLLTLKLSPNLRILPKDSRNIFYLEGEVRVQYEINKLKRLLTLVRDPESMQSNTIQDEQLLTEFEHIEVTKQEN